MRRREQVHRVERDPFGEMGQVPTPEIPGIVQSPINLPDKTEDVPEATVFQSAYAHLPPVSIPELVQYLSRDLLGQLRANIAAGSRVYFRDNQPLVTVANQSTTFRWPFMVRHVMVQNNSAGSVFVNFDGVASQGKFQVTAGSLLTIDVIAQSISVYATSALNIDGDVSGNLMIAGFM